METLDKVELKLKKIADKYANLEFNSNNYDIGGGLSDEKFASRRHEDAKYDCGKLTFGEASQLFKKATGLEVNLVKEIIEYAVPDMEWHHAGKLPKSYGGGMKKTYFLNASEINKLATNWNLFVEKLDSLKKQKEEEFKLNEILKQKRIEFLKANAKRVERTLTKPEYFFLTETEMNGKYGWFDSSKHSYNLPEYYSGWEFDSLEKLTEFNNIK